MLLRVFSIVLAVLALSASAADVDVRRTPVVEAVSKSLPWVVSIGTQNLVKVNDGYDDSFEEFYFFRLRRLKQKVVQEYSPLGSGIIIDPRGLVLTNLHVVRRARNIEIRLWNGDVATGEPVGYDAPSDLCLLRMTGVGHPESVKAAPLGLPDDVMLGETVLTIGNPFGLEHSVAKGVLSALNRSYSDDSYPFNDILQTDAAINPGNSGGPLINLNGELIGINQAIRKNASGIGFAIPVKRIEQFLSHWLLPSRFSDAMIGIAGRDDLSWGEHGVVLPELSADSPLAQAGLSGGDQIVAVNGRPLTRLIDFGKAVCLLKSGDRVSMTRSDGKVVTVQAMPMTCDQLIQARLGMQVQELTPTLREAMGILEPIQGLVISEITPENPFMSKKEEWRKVINRGDILLKADDKVVGTRQELEEVLRHAHSGQSVRLLVLSFLHSRQQVVQVDIHASLY